MSLLRHPRRGLAGHRAFLLEQTVADHVLYLDDDVWLAPGTVARLRTALRVLRCGFVGAAVHGLSYLDDERPQETQGYEEWPGPPDRSTSPRKPRPGNAGSCTTPRTSSTWSGGCVLFDRAKPLDSGGFDFWPDLPDHHVGEDVVAQTNVLARRGGAGIIPSGAVHLEATTTLPVRDIDAPHVLPTARSS